MNNWKQKYDAKKQYPRHPQAHRLGGIHMNYTDDARIFALAGAILNQIGLKVAKGDFNLATITKPIILTYPQTSLECLSCDYHYTDTYLTEATNCKDPLLRMQLVVANEIASIHKAHALLQTLAPIDCTLGETSQRTLPNGTQFYAEFIKTEPPTSLFEVIGPNNDWKIHGTEEVVAEIHPTFTQIIGKNSKPKFLKFKDGKTYKIEVPTMIINGLMKGDRVLNKMNQVSIECVQDKLVAQINFSYIYEGKVSKIKNKIMFWSQTEKPISDLVDVKINKLINTDDDDEVFTLSRGSGSWLSHLEFDGELFWRINDPVQEWVSGDNLLASDSSFRLDKVLMLKGEVEKAQQARNDIEYLANQDLATRRQFRRK